MNKEDQIMGAFRELLNKWVSLNKFNMEKSLKEYKSSEIHCVDYIKKNDDSNVTRLAEAFYMTGGAISKLTKRLINKGVLESYRRVDNKKEIYFRLTEKGEDIYKIHDGLHEEFKERDKAVYENITEQEFDNMLAFAENYIKHLDAEIKKSGVEI